MRKHSSPREARAALAKVGGRLVHVCVTAGQRVSYRPYLSASAALHKLLASPEMAEAIRDAVAAAAAAGVDGAAGAGAGEASARFGAGVGVGMAANSIAASAAIAAAAAAATAAAAAASPPPTTTSSPSSSSSGLVVEKASIDEAYVQLPAGCAPLATSAPAAAAAVRELVKRRLNLVVSVGAAHNKLLAKLASVASKPDGVLVVATEEDAAALMARTPAVKLPGREGVHNMTPLHIPHSSPAP